MRVFQRRCLILFILVVFTAIPFQILAENETTGVSDLDSKVRTFLEETRYRWHNMNVPARDGQFLYNLIVENNYTRALEIGTSTGHSAIWIAWALSKTGGRLITIEIDESVHRQALANFEAAGLSDYIDARLANAHDLVKELEGPFDFVFSDADKNWYKQYFIDVAPKMTVGGCFTAHNITVGRGGRARRGGGIQEFVDYVMGRTDFETTIETEKASGISVSYKKE